MSEQYYEEPEDERCQEHGAPVEEVERFVGFAGGPSYLTTFACGCQTLDESGDIAAAI